MNKAKSSNINYTQLSNYYLLAYWYCIESEENESHSHDEELKKELKSRFGEIPTKKKYQTAVDEIDYNDSFINEVILKADYSNFFKYLLMHRGHRFLNMILTFTLLFGLLDIFFFIFWVNAGTLFTDNNIYLLLSGILLPTLFIIFQLSSFFRKRIFSFILNNIRLGDLLRILNEKDDIFLEKDLNTKHVFNGQISPVYNPPPQPISKKEKYCKEIIQYYKDGKYKSNFNILIVFFAIDYLILYHAQAAYKDYLLELGLEILDRIYAFKRESIIIKYYIGYYSIQLELFDRATTMFSEYLRIKSNDISAQILLDIAEYLNKKNNIETE